MSRDFWRALYSMKISRRIKKTTPWHQIEQISFRNIHEKSGDSSEDDEYSSTHDEDDEKGSKYDEDEIECNQDDSRSSNDDLEADVGLEGNEDFEKEAEINRSDLECEEEGSGIDGDDSDNDEGDSESDENSNG